jgi:predicted flap endonuclease-1-like 5' DNA nuclease
LVIRSIRYGAIWHFAQIATWSAENVKWVGSYLAFPGRIDREKWIDQARALATVHKTELCPMPLAADAASET